MWIRIVNIDSAKPAISLVVAPENTEESFAEIDSFVSKCRTPGFDNIRLYYQSGISRSVIGRLKDLCSAADLEDPKLHRPNRDFQKDVFDFWSNQGCQAAVGNADIEYQMCVDDLEAAANDLDTVVMLISESLDLDPRNHFRLRLCVHELATNTAEHGNFNTNSPGICVRLLFTSRLVEGSYADNASAFINESTANAELLEEHIKSRRKRGLGLHLMNAICDDWQYERVGAWNVTTFTLEIGQTETVLKER